MARPRETRSTGLTSLTASAALPVVRRTNQATKTPSANAWQAEAWAFYDTIGELRYATNWFSNALSRATLYAAERQPNGTYKRLESGEQHDMLQAIFGENESEMLKEMGKHYFVPGEWYLIGRKLDGKERTERGKPEDWQIYSSKEVSKVNGEWVIKPGGNRAERITLKKGDFISRLWKGHPTAHNDPDSPVRAVLPVLREIQGLTDHIQAQTTSRLSGAGLALFPSELEFPPPPGQDSLNNAEALMDLLTRAMAAAKQNPGSAEANVPIVLTMPGEYIEKVTRISFWSDMDEKAAEMRKGAIGRMALGLDMPPEVLTGTADLNHWGSWQVEESSIKAHIEPALETMCAGLTQVLFSPLRESEDEPMVVVRYDTSQLRLRPNRSREAIELWDRGAITLDGLLRETGFAGDKAQNEDIKLFILLKMASGSATPEMVVEAARALGVTQVQAVGDVPNESRPAPSLDRHPTRDLPEGIDTASLRLVMMRAMERAGNRMKNGMKGAQFAMIASCDLYLHAAPSSDQFDYLLEDAFSWLPRVVPAQHVDAVEKALTRYAHTILSASLPITEEGIRDHLIATMTPRTHEGESHA